MARHYPIVLETEDSGAVSAHVPGSSVCAVADSHANVKRTIRAVLAEYLKAHPAILFVARRRNGSEGLAQRKRVSVS
jgi:hypothetical protein